MCKVKTVGRKLFSVAWLSSAALRFRDPITVRLSDRFFVDVTSPTLVDGRWNGKRGE
jgi:hypothetical protein